MAKKASVLKTAFNTEATSLPFALRISDFEVALQDVYDFFSDVNELLSSKARHHLDDMMRPAALSGMISDIGVDPSGWTEVGLGN